MTDTGKVKSYVDGRTCIRFVNNHVVSYNASMGGCVEFDFHLCDCESRCSLVIEFLLKIFEISAYRIYSHFINLYTRYIDQFHRKFFVLSRYYNVGVRNGYVKSAFNKVTKKIISEDRLM